VVLLIRLFGDCSPLAMVPGAGSLWPLACGDSLACRAALPLLAFLHHQLVRIQLPHVAAKWCLFLRPQSNFGKQLARFRQEPPQGRGCRVSVEGSRLSRPFLQQSLDCCSTFLSQQPPCVLVILICTEE